MSDKYPMTPRCHARMKVELKKLKEVDRPANSKAIEIARAHGDLSENADYDAAKDQQGMINARIEELETKIALAEVIDPAKLSGDRVVFGATVTVEDGDSGEESTYMIVGEDESDIKAGLISVAAPVARAMIGKTVGDTATVKTPRGERELEIVDLEFKPLPAD